MSRGSSYRHMLALSVLVLLGTSACAKKTVQMDDPVPAPPVARVQPEAAPAPPAPAPVPVQLGDVFFDFDQSRLRADGLATLNSNGKALREDPSLRVVLEGHCDERGTVEYNLALGERRARTTKDYLVSYGIDGARISTVSYGEERPFVQGHGEAAWAQNRRVHFVPSGRETSQAERVR